MTCHDLAEFLVDYLDGDLPALIHQQFEAHVGGCADCVNYQQQYQDTIRLTANAGDDRQIADVPEELVRAVMAKARG